MPRANWGVSSRDIDNFDRDSQYAPYDGPIPPNGVYVFKIKVLKFVAATREKSPQLRIGLELQPRSRNAEEKRYAGYFIMAFIPVMDKTQFRYVPFLDAIGVSGKEFETGTITDEEGNIKKIGRWRNSGNEFVKAEIKDSTDKEGNARKEPGWFGPVTESDDEEEDFEDEEDGEYADDDEDGEWE